ncbi:flagellar basal body rod protein FlgC [Litorivivens sp.]|uniref:flagellar basal body rod protein FlgC n=1 Tax=Litorivivens sp. TaxID=2020868 RepID=UPI003564382B
MSMFKVLDIAGSAMNAQLVRLNTTASNMANADSVATTEAEAYRAKQPVFAALLQETANAAAGVQVTGIVESQAPVIKRYEPGNPMADADGYVFGSNVNEVEEMANMISASRSFQNNSEVFNTSKDLMMRTLQLGR